MNAFPVDAFAAHRKLAVIDVADVPLLVGIDVVDARQRLQPHRILPLVEVARLVEAEILHQLAHFVHAGIADGEDAVIGLEHRALRGKEHVAMERPDQRTEQLHANGRVVLLEIAPLAVEQILVVVRRIDGQPIDVRKIRRIDRVRPAQMFVVAMQHERRARKHAARDMPAFAGLQHDLVPGDRPGIRLMRIDQQPGCAVRACDADRPPIRSNRSPAAVCRPCRCSVCAAWNQGHKRTAS